MVVETTFVKDINGMEMKELKVSLIKCGENLKNVNPLKLFIQFSLQAVVLVPALVHGLLRV